MTQQMDVFKKNLEDFAAKHKDDIRRDPQFRLQFQEMCAAIGVDPLACEYFILVNWMRVKFQYEVVLACNYLILANLARLNSFNTQEHKISHSMLAQVFITWKHRHDDSLYSL
jgi:hypothetical protein